MFSIGKILVPIDFSDKSLEIIPAVKALAMQYGSEVILFHVAEPFYTIPATGISGPVMIPVPADAMAEHRDKMQNFAVDELMGTKVRRLVYEGEPVSHILTFTTQENVDLIAVPTRGHGSLRHFLIGSLTSKILHDSPCPVLTGVHLGDSHNADQGRKLSHIVCGIDLGRQAQEVYAWASQLAADCGARLTVVHAIAPMNPALPISPTPDLAIRLEELAREMIEKITTSIGGTTPSVVIEHDYPQRALCSTAKSTGADLLVIGRGPKDHPNGRLSSNAYAIIRQAPCPAISI
jgi:nucleotide-binding universal stress UspA family protein